MQEKILHAGLAGAARPMRAGAAGRGHGGGEKLRGAGGELILEEVKGTTNSNLNPEACDICVKGTACLLCMVRDACFIR